MVNRRMSTRLLPRWTRFGLLLGLLWLSGAAACLRVDQTITLNADGSGTLAFRYGMSEEDVAELQAMSQQALEAEGAPHEAPATPFDFDEKTVREEFEQYREDGVTLESLKTEVVGGWKYLDLTIRFQTLAGLARTEFVSDRGLRLTKRPNGDYAFHQSAPPDAGEGAMEGVQEMMADLMKGFRAVVSVVTPSDIVESNGDRVQGRRVTWVFDLAEDPRALERAQQMDLRVVFAGQGLDLPELDAAAGD
jgi:hypothetical protein